MTPGELLYIANCWCSKSSGYLFKVYQITQYNWLSQDNLNKCMDRIDKLNISNECEFEFECFIKNKKELQDKALNGRIDCFDFINNRVFEFKCVSSIEKDHYLQMGIYMYMIEHFKTNIIKNNDKKTIDIDDKIKKENNNYELIQSSIEKIKQIIVQLNENTLSTDNKNDFNSKSIQNMKKQLNEKRGLILQTQERQWVLDNLKTEHKKIRDIIIKNKNKKTEYYVYNILTDELAKVSCSMKGLTKMIKYLIESKYIVEPKINDTDFIEFNQSLRDTYFIGEK
jgi:hypothetical protein